MFVSDKATNHRETVRVFAKIYVKVSAVRCLKSRVKKKR